MARCEALLCVAGMSDTSQSGAPTASTGPYVGLAVFCTRIDRQADGSIDIIGVVESVNLASPFSPPLTNNSLMMTVVVSVRGGTLRGALPLAIRGHYPDGTPGTTLSQLVEFTDAQPTVTMALPIQIAIGDLGVYWFDITLNQRLLTRIALDINRGAMWQ
jgi:hypothetical protein